MTTKQIQNLLQYLGYYEGIPDGIPGPMTRSATERFQNDFGGIQANGEPGNETQKALTHAVAYGMPERDTAVGDKSETTAEDSSEAGTFWDEIDYFTPEEFACKCGGRYCNGYPHAIQPLMVQICDRARKWSGHPITVVSGLRCETHNRNEKGVWNSQHQYGEAADLYFAGVGANAALAWLQSQPDVRYAYRIEGCNNIHFDIQPVGR